MSSSLPRDRVTGSGSVTTRRQVIAANTHGRQAWQLTVRRLIVFRDHRHGIFAPHAVKYAMNFQKMEVLLNQQQSYEQMLKRHLDGYRLGRLGGVKSGEFVSSNGTSRPYGHILPRDLKWLNILEPFRHEIMEYQVARGVSLHQYFHHLNSSQAFAFNLFIPLFQHARPALAAALRTDSMQDLALEHCVDPVERTQVDVLWTLDDATCVYCEVKLSETEFGSVDGLGRYQRMLEETYRPMLERQLEAAVWDTNGALFFKFYQVYRNLWLAARPGHDTDQVRFLLPRANTILTDQLSEALDFVRAGLRSRVQVLYVEDVLRLLAERPETAWYGRMLEEKYVPGSDLQAEPFPVAARPQ